MFEKSIKLSFEIFKFRILKNRIIIIIMNQQLTKIIVIDKEKAKAKLGSRYSFRNLMSVP